MSFLCATALAENKSHSKEKDNLQAAFPDDPALLQDREPVVLPLAPSSETTLEDATPITSDDSMPSPSLSTRLESKKPWYSIDHFTFTYFGVFDGPSMTSASDYEINPTTGKPDLTSPVQLDNQFKFDYWFNKNWGVGLVGNFNYQPTVTPIYVNQDSGVRVSYQKFIDDPHWDTFLDLRFMYPSQDDSLAGHRIGTVQSLQSINYHFLGTKWTVGYLGFINQYFFGPGGNGKDNDTYSAPNVSYQLLSKLALVSFYEMYPLHSLGDNLGIFSKKQPTDVSTGINWEIAKNLTISPQIMIFPDNPEFSNDRFILYISGSML